MKFFFYFTLTVQYTQWAIKTPKQCYSYNSVKSYPILEFFTQTFKETLCMTIIKISTSL